MEGHIQAPHTIDDSIDKALKSAKFGLFGLIQGQKEQKLAEQWNFIDVRSQRQTSTRQLIRVQAARKPKTKHHITPLQYRKIRPIKSREMVPSIYSESTAIHCGRACLVHHDYKPHSRFSSCKPVSILGAGRIDPFQSFPIDSSSMGLHECFDFWVTAALPEVHPIDKQGIANPLCKAWFPAIFSNPLLFHSTILSASTMLDILHRNNAHRLLRIYHEGEIMKELVKELNNPKTSYTFDEILIAVKVLALDTGTILPSVDDSPFNTPLSGFGWIDIQGGAMHNEIHSKALYDLVKMRGGLHKLKIPYVGNIMSRVAIRDSTISLQASPFPYIAAFDQPREGIWNSTTISQVFKSRGKLLPKLALLGFDHRLLNLSYDLCEQTTRIQEHCERIVVMSKYDFMLYKDMRDEIQHRLLSLPKLDSEPVYESFRLSLLIYSFAVTYGGASFDLPIRKRLVLHLVSALRKTRLDHNQCWNLFPESFLWSLFLGGITAIGIQERVWFVKRISYMIALLDLRQWVDVKGVLNSLLWLDTACDVGAKALYDEVSAYASFEASYPSFKS